MKKVWKKIHILVVYFVFACLYSFVNIYYKYTIFRFSMPPSIKTNPFITYPGNFQTTLLLSKYVNE